MKGLLKIASDLDDRGVHHVADEIDRLVMSEVGYYPPPAPEEDDVMLMQQQPEVDPLPTNTGEPSLFPPYDPLKVHGPLDNKISPSPRMKRRKTRNMKFVR